MSSSEIDVLMQFLFKQRGIDFSAYHPDLIEKRIQQHLSQSGIKSIKEFIKLMEIDEEQLDGLIHSFTINFSYFFRDDLSFAVLKNYVIPELIRQKIKSGDPYMRIWSAACASGEEAVSVAILFKELIANEKNCPEVRIFATDIDKKSLRDAEKGSYSESQLHNVPLGITKKYFLKDGVNYKVIPEIAAMIKYSHYNLMDSASSVPRDSIFGGFDLVLCRNVLIYFPPENQETIQSKLIKSLHKSGYLMLGESETPASSLSSKLLRINPMCKIYKKN